MKKTIFLAIAMLFACLPLGAKDVTWQFNPVYTYGTSSPQSVPTAGYKGTLYFNTETKNVYIKKDDGPTTNWMLLGSTVAEAVLLTTDQSVAGNKSFTGDTMSVANYLQVGTGPTFDGPVSGAGYIEVGSGGSAFSWIGADGSQGVANVGIGDGTHFVTLQSWNNGTPGHTQEGQLEIIGSNPTPQRFWLDPNNAAIFGITDVNGPYTPNENIFVGMLDSYDYSGAQFGANFKIDQVKFGTFNTDIPVASISSGGNFVLANAIRVGNANLDPIGSVDGYIETGVLNEGFSGPHPAIAYIGAVDGYAQMGFADGIGGANFAANGTDVDGGSSSGQMFLNNAAGGNVAKIYFDAPASSIFGLKGFSTNDRIWVGLAEHIDYSGTGFGAQFKQGSVDFAASPTGSAVVSVASSGNVTLVSGQLNIATNSSPASAGATCTKGTINWDSGFIYVCVNTNTWKRAAISTWP